MEQFTEEEVRILKEMIAAKRRGDAYMMDLEARAARLARGELTKADKELYNYRFKHTVMALYESSKVD